MNTILFLAANPANTTQLQLDEEIREIDSRIRRAELRDKFEIKQQWAVRVEDLQEALLRYQPTIVHFSGHGSPSGEIVLKDKNGNARVVPKEALADLFSVLKDNIRCVVLNACFTQAQADGIAESIECVIGMSRAISDDGAISFAASFYQALGYGRNIKTAFDLGCSQIGLDGLSEQDIPKLVAKNCDPRVIFIGRNQLSARTRFLSDVHSPFDSISLDSRNIDRNYVEIPDSVFPHPLNDREKQTLRAQFTLKLKETNKEVNIDAPAYAPLGAIAEYLIKELFPHVSHRNYRWTLTKDDKQLPPEHNLVTANVKPGDILVLFGDPIQIMFWAPQLIRPRLPRQEE